MSQKSKNLCRFTRELDEKLIELVSENEVLYDTGHKYYKDLNVRDDVWLAISSIVGKTDNQASSSSGKKSFSDASTQIENYNNFSDASIQTEDCKTFSNTSIETENVTLKVQDCKTRWRSLRDLYHRKKKDQKLGKKIRSPWDYMEPMSFLEEFTTEKKATQSDTPQDQDDEETKIDIKQEFDPDVPSTSTTHPSSRTEEPPPPKKFKTDECPHHHSHYETPAILHLLREIRDLAKARQDPITAFFDSMAKTVINFPPAQAAEVKLKVCQVVTEMECKILEESGNYPDNFESFD